MIRTKTCVHCGKEFYPKTLRAIYCSDECRREGDKERKREEYAKANGIGEERTCVVCGKKFIAKSKGTDTCSQKCSNHKSQYLNGRVKSLQKKEYEKVCVVCGDKFKTKNPNQITCCAECSQKNRTEKHRKNDRANYERRNKETRDNIVNAYMSEPPKGFDVVDIKYIVENGISKLSMTLKCKTCGSVSSHNPRKYRKDFICEECKSVKAKTETRERELKQNTRTLAKKIWLHVHPNSKLFYSVKKVCPECGNTFIAHIPGSVYCSEQCHRKAGNRKSRSHYKDRCSPNQYIDTDINTKTVAAKDNNICYICGEPVDWDDYHHSENGAFIAGPNYPSVDHVKPLSKGGMHSWDNVRLAHFHCNTIKRDSYELQIKTMEHSQGESASS